MPVITPYAFILREENKIDIEHIECLLESKYLSVLCSQNLQNQTKSYFQTGGARPVHRSWIRVCNY